MKVTAPSRRSAAFTWHGEPHMGASGNMLYHSRTFEGVFTNMTIPQHRCGRGRRYNAVAENDHDDGEIVAFGPVSENDIVSTTLSTSTHIHR